MSRPREVVFFFLRLLLLYCVLTALWPVLARSYGRAYVAIAGACFSSYGRDASVQFARAERADGFDVEIVLRNRRTGGSNVSRRSARYTAYTMTALSAALVLATPLPWRRRLRALFWTLLTVHLVIAASLGLFLLDAFSNRDLLAAFRLAPIPKTLLRIAVYHTSVLPTFPFVLPFPLWGLSTFRHGDWEMFGLRRPAPRQGGCEMGKRGKGE